jgi:hypothetical protein
VSRSDAQIAEPPVAEHKADPRVVTNTPTGRISAEIQYRGSNIEDRISKIAPQVPIAHRPSPIADRRSQIARTLPPLVSRPEIADSGQPIVRL